MTTSLGKRQPSGINIVYIYYALATLAFKYENYKMAREAFEKLQTLKIPAKWVAKIDMQHLKLRAKPF